MSEYVELMQLRKLALLNDEDEIAQALMDMALELDAAGLVTEDDRLAAAYL